MKAASWNLWSANSRKSRLTEVAILGDQHFGVRSDSPHFHNNMELFFSKVFFPQLEEHGIKKVINVGDVFDNRKKIDMLTANKARKYFFDPLAKANIHMDIIAGNHDLFYREQSDVTALREILAQYKNIKFYTEPAIVDDLVYIPWINKSNREETFKFISKNADKNTVAFGHLELVGHQMYRGNVALHGDDPASFKDFEHVYSGHYHHRSTQGNITYVGSISQHTWADYGDVRGFHVFDTDTHQIHFAGSQYNMFDVVTFDDSFKVPSDEMLQRLAKGKFLRVQAGDVKQSKLDEFCMKLEVAGAVKVQVMAPKSNILAEQRHDENVDVEDTPTLIRSVVEDDLVYDKLIKYFNQAAAL